MPVCFWPIATPPSNWGPSGPKSTFRSVSSRILRIKRKGDTPDNKVHCTPLWNVYSCLLVGGHLLYQTACIVSLKWYRYMRIARYYYVLIIFDPPSSRIWKRWIWRSVLNRRASRRFTCWDQLSFPHAFGTCHGESAPMSFARRTEERPLVKCFKRLPGSDSGILQTEKKLGKTRSS